MEVREGQEQIIELTPGILWIGVRDWHRRLFDAFMKLPYGTSYNAYLVLGQDGVALIDTVKPDFGQVLERKLAQALQGRKVDYLVMNHAEPDHAGSIPRLMARFPAARLVATRRGVDMAHTFFGVPAERAMAVKDGDTLELGRKTLRFLEAPWIHWPETMMSFCPEAGVLFPCDFLGAHMATSRLFDDEVGDVLLPEAKTYYGSIMMPFAKSAERALDKAKALALKFIAPSHGPIYRNPARILGAYEQWVRGPLPPKVVALYVSMYGSSDALIEAACAAVEAEGAGVVPYELCSAETIHIARDLVDASALLLGTPTFLGGTHPLMTGALELLRLVRPRGKVVAVIGSYGWSGGAAAKAKEVLSPVGFEIMDTLEVNGPPRPADLEKAREIGKRLAERVKGKPAS